MEAAVRHRRFWRAFNRPVYLFLRMKFGLTSEPCEIDGPCIVVPNHVTDWDPLFVAASFPRKVLYYVASEHIFRLGWLSGLLNYFLAPIARRKASVAADTAMTVLRRLKEGHSVCLFGEGEASWNGRTGHVFPATGRMIRASGATLVTYRIEGGYLADPRWGRRTRRGRIRGHAVGVYPAAELRKMKPDEINALIERDIAEDAWARQRELSVAYAGRGTAEHLETLLFLCPHCHKTGTLHSRGDILRCTCGAQWSLTPQGLFEPQEPFADVAQWDDWQQAQLRDGTAEARFEDAHVRLSEVSEGHRQTPLGEETLRLADGTLGFGAQSWPLADVPHMAMVQNHLLVFSFGEHYYELRATEPSCLRKYLLAWQNAHPEL